MKRLVRIGTMLTFLTGCLAAYGADSQDSKGQHGHEGEEAVDVKKIRGEIIDITCAIRHDSTGPDHEKCAIYCANLGMPLGLLEDGTGKIYLIIPSGHGDPKEAVLSFISKHVEVEGIVYARGDLTTIEVVDIAVLKGEAQAGGAPAKGHDAHAH